MKANADSLVCLAGLDIGALLGRASESLPLGMAWRCRPSGYGLLQIHDGRWRCWRSSYRSCSFSDLAAGPLIDVRHMLRHQLAY